MGDEAIMEEPSLGDEAFGAAQLASWWELATRAAGGPAAKGDRAGLEEPACNPDGITSSRVIVCALETSTTPDDGWTPSTPEGGRRPLLLRNEAIRVAPRIGLRCSQGSSRCSQGSSRCSGPRSQRTASRLR